MTATAIDRRAIPPGVTENYWEAADGHRIRRIDWTVPEGEAARGSILFFPGRGDHYEKYIESMAEWHAAGWNVTGADWRGQAGSGRLGEDALTGHISDFGVWVSDLAALWQDWSAERPGPHVLAGHSMGGHLVLRALVEHRVDPDAAFLVAPMLGFRGPPVPFGFAHGVAKAMSSIGDPARPAWKWSEKPGEIPRDRMKLLTHDAERYEDEIWWRDARPELKMGPGSWGWVERGYASVREIFAPGALEAVETPVLLINVTEDKLVDPKATARAAERLPHATLANFGPEARHEILREVDAVRDRAQVTILAFLDQSTPEPK
ncbi:lysophospholipase [Blastomonas marina]|uniref:Lysophospholipase n=1 Tax=Blastomonas marina TaxID=1867408 RepID=A0ABQ1FEB1_9SPHN|nr:alpha/beta hydrolase [Blastomonas marina]GGA08572.1 lysophospholipase [Blastomonas marina]